MNSESNKCNVVNCDESSHNITEVKESYIKYDLVPFVGAGFSLNVKGFPNWSGLLSYLEIFDDYNLSGTSSTLKGALSDLIKKANYSDDNMTVGFLEDAFGDDGFRAVEFVLIAIVLARRSKDEKNKPIDHFELEGSKETLKRIVAKFVEDEINRVLYRCNECESIPSESENDVLSLHSKIINAKNIRTIITTNWDRIFERTSKQLLEKAEETTDINRLSLNVVHDVNGFGDWNPGGSKNLLKLHGCSSESKAMVFCESDYYSRMRSSTAIDYKFRSEIMTSDILMIGYSLVDINVRYVLHEIAELLLGQESVNRKSIYYVILGATKDEVHKYNFLKLRFGYKFINLNLPLNGQLKQKLNSDYWWDNEFNGSCKLICIKKADGSEKDCTDCSNNRVRRIKSALDNFLRYVLSDAGVEK